MFKEKAKKKFLLFYVILVYVFAFLFWWNYLLYSKIEQHYADLVKLESLKYQVYEGGTSADFKSTEEFQVLNDKFKRQKVMILTEGIVFFIILTLGMVKIFQSFKQEIAIARQQKNFILSITHELKSPLASIKLMNETMRLRALDKEKQNQLIASSLSEVDRLENLVENILIAAKIENDQYGFTKEALNLSVLSKQIITYYKERKEIDLSADIRDDIFIEGDKTCINSILNNLLDNATKYARNSTVTVTLKQTKNKVELAIADTGPGIPKEEHSAVFNKFYRVGNEETRQAKGTGLGLYIVKQLVQFQNGKVDIEHNLPSGVIFKIIFNI
tara:strand:- start:41 stop:1030 length:990 start_codon:yes stop_codon:yes gene_type:complete